MKENQKLTKQAIELLANLSDRNIQRAVSFMTGLSKNGDNLENADVRKIRIDETTVDSEVYSPYQNAVEYKDALSKYQAALEAAGLKGSILINIDDAVSLMETEVSEIVYQKAFHDGMRFILNTLAGKEVIEL